MQKKSIAVQISALLGASPSRIHYSCGMTGERRDIDQGTEVKEIHFGHGIDKISGQEVHSPALIEFENGEFSVTTTGALSAGNLGTRMTGAEVNMLSVKRLKSQGCKIIGPNGKEIHLD
jgi:hypothetical protein